MTREMAMQETDQLLAASDSDSGEVVTATREGLVLPTHVFVPAAAEHGHATAVLGKTIIDKAVQSSEERIREPLTTGFRQQVAQRSTGLRKRLCQTLSPAPDKPARIAVKAKKKIVFIDAADLIAVEAQGNYVLLWHASSSHMLRGAISKIAAKLDLHGFVRIHRSVLVNGALVEEIHPLPTGEYLLRVRGGRQFTVTRTYKRNLQLLAQLWIGMEGFAAG